jgi:hypothetical protein
MSAIAFLIAVAIALVATLVWAGITGGWSVRACAGMFVFALLLLVLPGWIHA